MLRHTPPQPDREDVRPEERDAYDRVVARQNWYRYDRFNELLPHDLEALPRDRVQPYFGALLNSPLIADHISELGVIYRTRGETEGSYSHADREWVDMVVSQELRWNMVLYAHMPDAVAVGVRAEAIRALRQGGDEDLTPRERTLATYIRRFLAGSVTEESYRAVEELLGVRGAVEYSAFIGHLLMTTRMMQAFGVPDKTDAEVDELLEGIAGGSVELPDPTARIPPL